MKQKCEGERRLRRGGIRVIGIRDVHGADWEWDGDSERGVMGTEEYEEGEGWYRERGW